MAPHNNPEFVTRPFSKSCEVIYTISSLSLSEKAERFSSSLLNQESVERCSSNSVRQDRDPETIALVSSQNHRNASVAVQDESCERPKWINMTIVISSILSIALNLIMAIAAFAIGAMRDSAATYAFAVDCTLDSISSGILLWRFLGKEDFESMKKERKACLILGAIFSLAAVCLTIKAGIDIVQRDHPVTFQALCVLAIIGSILCFVMAIAKFYLARKVNSSSLQLDAVNSVISGLLAIIIIVSDKIYQYNNAVWFIEPMMSIILLAVLFVYGLKVIYDNRKKPRCDSYQPI